jgi:hypothetical protein
MLNEVFRRRDISARAKGLFAYIMTLPDDWKIQKEELYSHFTEGRDALDKAFRELINVGYIKNERLRDEAGKIIGFRFVVKESITLENHNTENQCYGEEETPRDQDTEMPCDGDDKSGEQSTTLKSHDTGNQSLENRKVENHDTENPQLLSTEVLKTKGLITHTLNSGACEKNKPKQVGNDPPMLTDHFPEIDWKMLYAEIVSAGFPKPGSEINFAMRGRNAINSLAGLTWEQILGAVRNYGEVKKLQSTWWRSTSSFFSWAQNQIDRFLPENFNLGDYELGSEKAESESEYYARRIREISGEETG